MMTMTMMTTVGGGGEALTNCPAADPCRHALDEPFTHLWQGLLRMQLRGQSGAAEVAEGVDVAVRAEILHGLDPWNQTHLENRSRRCKKVFCSLSKQTEVFSPSPPGCASWACRRVASQRRCPRNIGHLRSCTPEHQERPL